MQLHPRSALARAQAAVCVVTVTAALAVVPALVSTASAAESRASTSPCASAQAAVQQAQHQQAAAAKALAKAQKALAKAKKSTAHKKAKVAKAKKGLAKAKKGYAAAHRAVASRQASARSACAAGSAPTPASTTGAKLRLLGVGEGLGAGAVGPTQLTALLEQLLPGVTDSLSADELGDLLAGFNSVSSIDPTGALSVLGGLLSPDQVTALLGGAASPEALTELIGDIIGQLSSLGGDLPIPTDFDPSGLWETFSGIFGQLGAGQLGSLLQLLTTGLGAGGSAFDVDQLTGLINSLVPGISDDFDPGQLTSMLGALNGASLDPATLANLLGGAFSPSQLQSVLAGTAGQDLLGSVIAQVMAQLGTAGQGGLDLPGALGAGQIAGLVSTVTSLLTGITGGGGGGGGLPVVCGLIPIPLLCP